ncbi:hypothetical protein Sjap_019760 [Stephania japonica]|uniref:S-protein homolog n=1 Tax=Stephania japonica TaxID=461633 RepID=A0AAP0F0S2_9MAGN
MGALMNRRSSLLLLLVIILLVDSTTAFSLFPKKHVHVANNLTSSTSLDVHCKSGDDDLGEQAVAYNQEFSWSFRDSIIGNTKFDCEVGWTDSNGQKYGQTFESYKAVDTSCHPDCTWYCSKQGIYFYDDSTESYVLKFYWQAIPPQS